jgi:hypothetical protein
VHLATGGLRVRNKSPARGVILAAAGLCLGLLTLGPALGRGYLLDYDMVFVPSPQFNASMFGLTGTLPRAVPSDAVIAMLARIAPADVVQKLVLLAILVLACAGAAKLLADQHWLAGLAAGVFYAWNPFLAERLLLGQWALLLGYAGLPWVLDVLVRPAATAAAWFWRLVAALLPAAIGGFAAMSVTALLALPAAACQPVPMRRRSSSVAVTSAAILLLSLPWLIPSLSGQIHASPAGVSAFAARADTPFGTIGSLLMLGGAWNAQTVPVGYGGWASALWLGLALVSVVGFVLLGRRRLPGLLVASLIGLFIALLGAVGAGQDLLRAMIAFWPGFAMLRDGQQFVAPLALAEAVGLGLGVAWILQPGRMRSFRDGRVAVAVGALVAPVLLLPGLAWGAAGRFHPVQYPTAWLAAGRLINADHAPGMALLLPWGAYRRFAWNDAEAVLDPWPRLLGRQVIWDDGVQVGSTRLPPESPISAQLDGLVASGAPLTAELDRLGIRYVVVDAGFARTGANPAAARLARCRVVFARPGLMIYRVPESGLSKPLATIRHEEFPGPR